ncbi:MAG: hypothetical protein GX639_05175 [Fibrobacter sp.]|nr:hypothetical protein [Fibrobacter sp.]
MNEDTDIVITKMINDRFNLLTPEERLLKCFGMYETAKMLIMSSIPSNMNEKEKRLFFFKRMQGFDLPEKVDDGRKTL